MATIFVVMGQTGEYSDRNEWYVGARFTEAAANEMEKACTDYAEEVGLLRGGSNRPDPDLDFDQRIALLAAGPDKVGPVYSPSSVDYVVLKLDLTGSHDDATEFFDALMKELHHG